MPLDPAQWIRDGQQYLVEVQAEFKKVTWPPQKEAIVGTVAVLVIVAAMTTVLGVVDFILSQVLGMLIQ
jgi:preprotein translocase SecE subunit